MAEPEALRPGSEILVTIDSVLPDILVVTYVRGSQKFQGALLESTKRGLPCGIEPPEAIKGSGPDGDKLSSIASRFSYFQDKRHAASIIASKTGQRKNNPSVKSKNARPTVRLRPRQVLCNHCSSICNENSENVGRKRKLNETNSHKTNDQHVVTRRSDRVTRQQNPNKLQSISNVIDHSDESSSSKTNSSYSSSHFSGSTKFRTILLPKASSLRNLRIDTARETSSTNSSTVADKPKSRIALVEEARSIFWNGRDIEDVEEEESSRSVGPPEVETNPITNYSATPRRLSTSSVESAKIPCTEDDKETVTTADTTVRTPSVRMARKKRSVGLMEDLWDETIFEDPARITKTTPIIKISFGSQGSGTVVKIPPKVHHSYNTEPEDIFLEKDPLALPNSESLNETEISILPEEEFQPTPEEDPLKLPIHKESEASAKAAKKALKKAKKKALRKMYALGSPGRSPCNSMSPRYSLNYDKMLFHHRKHKVKHKKKHKEERKHKIQQKEQFGQQQNHEHLNFLKEINGEEKQNWDVLQDNDSGFIKEQCLKQKLSISLKRLNTNAYARCDYMSNASSGCKSPGVSSDELLSEHDHETERLEEAPNYSSGTTNPLVMRMTSSSNEHCLNNAGTRMDVGDVVWGKVHGFPWWPGKVLSILMDTCKDDGTPLGPQAHVAWYGSSTSSIMSCDQLSPFLETFKTRYNKKKKGPYKEAIRQAQNEAKSQIALSSTSNVLNVCGSPREVNVLS